MAHDKIIIYPVSHNTVIPETPPVKQQPKIIHQKVRILIPCQKCGTGFPNLNEYYLHYRQNHPEIVEVRPYFSKFHEFLLIFRFSFLLAFMAFV